MTARWAINVHAETKLLNTDGFSSHSVEKATQKVQQISGGSPRAKRV